MTTEAVFARAFTPKQLENQRLFRVGPSVMPEQPGDTAKRVVRKAAILAGSTALDLAESGLFEKLIKPKEDTLDALKKKAWDMTGITTSDAQSAKRAEQVRFVKERTKLNVVEFVEDGLSDELQVVGMNAILRKMTGLDEVSYPSATARFISNWTNLLAWTSAKFNRMKFWKKPWNVVNAVNVEAAIGLLEEVPGVGKLVERAHGAVNTLLTKEGVQLVNGVAVGAVSAINITKNMIYGDVKPLEGPRPQAPVSA